MTIHALPSALLLGAGAVLGLVSLVLFLRGLHQRRVAAAFSARAVEAQAEVTGLSAKDVSLATNPDTVYFPVVAFTTADGQQIEAECLTGVHPPPPRVGETVTVHYDPQHPSQVEVAGEEDPATAGLTSFLLARVFLGLAVATPLAWLVLAFVVWTS